ncbi:hypothetical protein KKF91_17605 [Myxococcota bacterium]|nr:hypothetical protein [Myxococcota bacterium]MBU1432358.1 hypothetical protein [Myxococcota bacterium]MBU1900313.1 hypothetical protein [Myxococcota bacterium]
MIKPLLNFIQHHKGQGTTEHLIEMAIAQNGYLVVGDVAEAIRRERSRHGLKIFSVEEMMESEDSWRWESEQPGPLFFDPSAMAWLAEHLTKAEPAE